MRMDKRLACVLISLMAAAAGVQAQPCITLPPPANGTIALHSTLCPDSFITLSAWDWGSPAPNGSVILASSTPAEGYLYPLGEDFFITLDGKVGIGTTSPAHTLQIGSGLDLPDTQMLKLRVVGNEPASWKGGAAFGHNKAAVILGEISDFATVGAHTPVLDHWADLRLVGTSLIFGTADPAVSEKMRFTGPGNLGIGTEDPSEPLTVVRDLGAGSRANYLADFYNVPAADAGVRIGYSADGFATTGGLVVSANTKPLALGTNANQQVVMITNTGRVGIGLAPQLPQESLHVAGNILATGSITPGCSRDLKENIADLAYEDASDAVAGLVPVIFSYRADPNKEQHVGFVAEDVPALLATADRKGVSPIDVVAVLTKVVQQQQTELGVLRAQQDMLRQEIEALKAASD